MKTKNNVRKAILKSVAVLTSLFLISITVNAQGSFKNLLADNSFGTIAKALTEKPTEIKSESYDFIKEVVEPSLEIEDWMIADIVSVDDFNYREDIETNLELEDWMMEVTTDSFSKSSEESPLKLESWMLR